MDPMMKDAAAVADAVVTMTGPLGAWRSGESRESVEKAAIAQAEGYALRSVVGLVHLAEDPSVRRVASDLARSLQERAREAVAEGSIASRRSAECVAAPQFSEPGFIMPGHAARPVTPSQFDAAVHAGGVAERDTGLFGRLPIPSSRDGQDAFGKVSSLGAAIGVLSQRARSAEGGLADDYRSVATDLGVDLSKTLRMAFGQGHIRADSMSDSTLYTGMYEARMRRAEAPDQEQPKGLAAQAQSIGDKGAGIRSKGPEVASAPMAARSVGAER